MTGRVPIINASGDYEENLERLAKALNKSPMRRSVINVIYGRGSKPKSKKQIASLLGLSGSTQSLQDALEYMANHHLIARIPNDGSIKDGSRHLYAKDEFVRVNRAKIISLADDPKKLQNLPTKRKISVHLKNLPGNVTIRDLRKRKSLKILYVYANPDPDPDPRYYIRPDAEVRKVQEAIRGSRFRDNVSIEVRPAAGLSTIQDGLSDFAPDVVHFSGHSDATGILADNGEVCGAASEYISYELIGAAFAAMDKPPQVIVFNSCHSAGGRNKILQTVPFVIAMTKAVSDIAATAFSQRLYTALASGATIRSAFEQGIVSLAAASLDERATAQLYEKIGFDASKVTLT